MSQPERRSSKDTRQTLSFKQASGSPKRLTCVPCRERKVRCDRVFPRCGRCRHLGHQCSYRERSSNRANQVALINQLQERMNQAEARLALQSQNQHPHSVMALAGLPHPDHTTTQYLSQPHYPISNDQHHVNPAVSTEMIFTPASSTTGESLGMYPDAKSSVFRQNDVGVDPLSHTDLTMLQTPEIDFSTSQNYDPRWNQYSSSYNSASLSGCSELSAGTEDLHALHEVFFDRLIPCLPIISRERFYREVYQPHWEPSIQALSYAIAATAILATRNQQSLERLYYATARRFLDEAELRGDPRTMSNINNLQALILLQRYDIANHRAASACLTAVRAKELARMMRIADTDLLAVSNPYSSRSFTLPLPATETPIELEERRRCVWTLNILEVCLTLNYGEVKERSSTYVQPSTLLPCASLLDTEFTPHPMPSIINTTNLTPQTPITPFLATILTATLAERINTHATEHHKIHAPTQFTSPFWDRHYTTMKLFNGYTRIVQPLADIQTPYASPVALDLHIHIAALDLYLHQAALHESERQGLAPGVGQESRRRMKESALRIASAVSMKWAERDTQIAAMSLSTLLLPWCFTLSICTLQNEAASVLDDANGPLMSAIHVLSTALNDLEDGGMPWADSVLAT